MKRISPRWLPAILAPLLVASSLFLVNGQASAIDLPDKSAAEMLAMINTNPEISFSGRVVKKADLGLPPMNLVPDISQSMVDSMSKNLPEEMQEFIPQASVEGELALILEFLAGTHTANVYVDGPTRARVQVLDLLSERNFIRNGKDLWFYDAAKSRVTHTEVDLEKEADAKAEAEKWILANASEFPFDLTSPASVAEYFLSQAESSTNFAVDEDVRIAGRDAYQLVMSPKAAGSLIESVKFAIDAMSGLPLAVTIHANGKSDPAFEVAFDSIKFETPSSTIFDFTIPAGAVVEEIDLNELESLVKDSSSVEPRALPGAKDRKIQSEVERLKSEGWAAVVEIPANQISAESLLALRENRLFGELTKKVQGGQLFSTTLFNILFTDEGAIYAGAVTVEKLLEAAAK